MSEIAQDLRSSIRSFRRRPFYPLVAVSVLALGLAACVAVFTYINGFFQPFPGVDAKRLLRVFAVESEEPYQDISYLDYLDYAAANEAFAGITATQPFYAASVRRATETGVAFLEAVAGTYFDLLEVETVLGRGLVPTDDRPEADPAAVIAHSWWQGTFNGDETVIGSTLYLNNRPFTVVGVASPDFLGSTSGFRPNVWIPFARFRDRYTRWAEAAEDRNVPLVRVYGRLRDGIREGQGLAALGSVAAGLDETYPGREEPRRLRLEAATWIDPNVRLDEMPTVRLMMLAALGLLLLTCANVANLLLSVAVGRQRELAIRAAMGASPGRILRQVMTENVLQALLAGVIALLLAAPLSARLGSYFARPSVWGANVSREVSVDLRVVAFALAISVLTGLIAGLLPALRAAGWKLMPTLQTDSVVSGGGPPRFRSRKLPGLHDLLVAAQVAVSVVLLVVAGLVLRTLAAVGSLDPGFSYDRLVASYVSTSSTNVEEEGRHGFFQELVERLDDEPWVEAATVANLAPLSPQASIELRLEGQSDPATLIYSKVLPGFFETLDIEVLEGRGFLDTDTNGALDVAVVNEALVRRFFGQMEPVGSRLWMPGEEGGEERLFEIVGVVRDAKPQDFIGEPPAMAYFSFFQLYSPPGNALLISTTIDPATSIPLLYKWLREFEPYIAIVNVLPYTEVVRGFLYSQRMNAELFSTLAILGLGLAAVGIFSVVTLAVSRRTREVGVRMALGAQRADIGRLILGRALTPVAVGLGLGLAASLAVTRLVRNLLHGVEPIDPVTLTVGAAVLVVAATTAAFLPARRAAAVEPMTALRSD